MAKDSEKSLYWSVCNTTEPKKDESVAIGLDEIIVWNFFEIVVFKNRIKFTELT